MTRRCQMARILRHVVGMPEFRLVGGAKKRLEGAELVPRRTPASSFDREIGVPGLFNVRARSVPAAMPEESE